MYTEYDDDALEISLLSKNSWSSTRTCVSCEPLLIPSSMSLDRIDTGHSFVIARLMLVQRLVLYLLGTHSKQSCCGGNEDIEQE